MFYQRLKSRFLHVRNIPLVLGILTERSLLMYEKEPTSQSCSDKVDNNLNFLIFICSRKNKRHYKQKDQMN